MTKTQLSSTDAFDLRQALHVATLNALMASRRWEPGDLVFQGGTSLHLAHGSPRFSEDLDFLVNYTLDLNQVSEAMQARLNGIAWLPTGTSLSVSKAKDGRNPHAFVVSVGGPNLIGSVRVKVELWQTSVNALLSVQAVVVPVRLARGFGSGIQAFVPTAQLTEIYADKVFALAARPYLKPRDVFDLHWLHESGVARECSAENLRVRLATYPNETPSAWLDKAFARRTEMKNSVAMISADLSRWLPSTWPLNTAQVEEMVSTAAYSLGQGIDMMRKIRSEYSNDFESPSP